MTVLGQKPSTLILWVVLAIPAIPMISPLFGNDPRAFHRLLHPTGEWAARFMIIGMMASGLMLLFKGRQWPRWLVHHRRDIGVAAFVYAALHTIVYVIDRGTLDRIIEALPHTDIWTGWLAMLIFVPLALTSNNAATLLLPRRRSGPDPLGRAAQLGQLAPRRCALRPTYRPLGLPAVVLVPAAANTACHCLKRKRPAGSLLRAV